MRRPVKKRLLLVKDRGGRLGVTLLDFDASSVHLAQVSDGRKGMRRGRFESMIITMMRKSQLSSLIFQLFDARSGWIKCWTWAQCLSGTSRTPWRRLLRSISVPFWIVFRWEVTTGTRILEASSEEKRSWSRGERRLRELEQDVRAVAQGRHPRAHRRGARSHSERSHESHDSRWSRTAPRPRTRRSPPRAAGIPGRWP